MFSSKFFPSEIVIELFIGIFSSLDSTASLDSAGSCTIALLLGFSVLSLTSPDTLYRMASLFTVSSSLFLLLLQQILHFTPPPQQHTMQLNTMTQWYQDHFAS